MRSLRACLAALACSLLAAGCATVGGVLTSRGESIARAQCSGCHAIGAVGESRSPNAPPLRRIGRQYAKTSLAHELEAVSEVGHYAMPPTSLSPDEIDDLVDYIQHIAAAPTL